MAEARKHATPSRDEMMQEILAEAQDNEDRRKISDAKNIMNREKSKRNWSVINVTADDPRPPPMTEIGREENGKIVWYRDEAGVHKVFQEECVFRYNQARKSPIMKTSLASLNEMEDADLKMAKALVEGVHPLPDDLDEPTKTYLKELIDMAKKSAARSESEFKITRKQFSDFWRVVNEHTQSLVSGHHYRFYKAAAKDNYGLEAHALQLTLVGRSGVPPPRWSTVMQLLLAKGKVECLASNNRYLNLYEGDFNEYKSNVVGGKAMEKLIRT